jgi:hypothetical protein
MAEGKSSIIEMEFYERIGITGRRIETQEEGRNYGFKRRAAPTYLWYSRFAAQ